MRNKIVYFLVFVFILIAICFGFLFNKKNVPLEQISKLGYKNASIDNIVVDYPKPDSTVNNSFDITGKARGTWFFEASFPYIILDSNGTVIYGSFIKTTADWMTTDFVPFTVSVTLPQSYKGRAMVVLKKDNPSGIFEKDASVSFPIIIK